MRTENASIVYRLLAVVLLAALLLAPAAGAVQADPAGPTAPVNTTRKVETSIQTGGVDGALGAVEPKLETGSIIGLDAGILIIPGQTWYITYLVRPINSTTYPDQGDSFSINNGPNDWTVASISIAPANTIGNGRAVGQAYINPNTSNNTTTDAHVYWGWDDPTDGPATYINGTSITYPTRTYEDPYSGWGVYNATPTGGAEVDFTVTWNIPTSWSTYLCPGATSPYEYIGLSGVSTDPNYLYATLRSSSSYNGWRDILVRVSDPCPKPTVSVSKTGRVTGITDPLPQGGAGTVTVQWCFTTKNTSDANAFPVYLANYTVTDSTIGYNSGTRTVTLAPGATDTVCTSYTHNVTWPTNGSVCVTNTSGASVTANTPPGYGEITAGSPLNGFQSNRVFSASQTAANAGLQVCASPLAVDLAGFTATAAAEGVTLAWETVSETDNAGFNVYRAAGGSVGEEPQQEWTRVNEALIPALTPGSAQGNVYTWTDATVTAGTTWYMLEDVSLDGTATQHEPVSVTLAAPNAVHMTAFGAAVTAGPALGGLAVLALATLAGVAARKQRQERDREKG